MLQHHHASSVRRLAQFGSHGQACGSECCSLRAAADCVSCRSAQSTINLTHGVEQLRKRWQRRLHLLVEPRGNEAVHCPPWIWKHRMLHNVGTRHIWWWNCTEHGCLKYRGSVGSVVAGVGLKACSGVSGSRLQHLQPAAAQRSGRSPQALEVWKLGRDQPCAQGPGQEGEDGFETPGFQHLQGLILHFEVWSVAVFLWLGV